MSYLSSSGLRRLAFAGMGLAAAVSLAGGLVFLSTMASWRQRQVIFGRVVLAGTSKPIEGALVYVHSALPDEDGEGMNEYVRTSLDGGFSAKARGEVTIRAWKPGYALRAIASMGNAGALSERDIVLELREVVKGNLVAEHSGVYQIGPGNGFSFQLARVVDGDSDNADIVIVQDQRDGTLVTIEARGKGGIIFQPWNEKLDFYNSPEAPADGYEVRAVLRRPQEGLYFVRTRDGRHYAKFRLIVYLSYSPEGVPRLNLQQSQLWWAYQFDGTRDLEIAPGPNLFFPVEKFGLKRESLGAR